MSAPERWLPVVGFPGYDVSDAGQIRSHRAWRGLPTPRLIAVYPHTQNGYMVAKVRSADCRTVLIRVHAAVLEAFVRPRPKGAITRHLNGDKTDNRLSNLAWGDQSANALDAVSHGTHAMARRTHCNHGHALTEENVLRRSDHPGRVCRECVRLAGQRKRARARERAS